MKPKTRDDLTTARWRLPIIGLVALLVMAALAMLVIDRSTRNAATQDALESAQDDAAILASGLQSELDKFSLVPLVLAEDPEVHALLSGNAGLANKLNQRFEAQSLQTRAAAIYVMDRKGLTLAASNWQRPDSFVGSNYNFRRYFQRALANGSATQFALGTVSRKPGLYIARRIGPAESPSGVVAIKVEFDDLEQAWRAASAGVFVTDGEGVVLLTSRPQWRFHTTRPEDLAGRDEELDLVQFGLSELPELKVTDLGPPGQAAVAAPLLEAEQPISTDGWVLHLLVDPMKEVDSAVAAGRLYLLLAVALTLTLLAAAILLRRRRMLRAEAEIAGQTQRLREQLNQANRLATLGQISAGVGHEINQPLAAARLFAENGSKLLEDGRPADARKNFQRIIEMTERIGGITTELRRFSRRDSSERQDLPIGRAIDGAMLLLHDRIERTGATVALPPSDAMQTVVRAEPVRLEQVLVNLLQNALDAVGPNGRIDIALTIDDGACALSIIDDGPGVDPAMAERLFQPFATGKADGLGLGLVISRDIMRDLGGELSHLPRAKGACFVMRVPLT